MKNILQVCLSAYNSSIMQNELKVFFLQDFKKKSEASSNSEFPTLNQVIPFYNSILFKLNNYLGCKDLNDEPDIGDLTKKGNPENVIEGVIAARKKLKKFYTLALRGFLYSNATSNTDLTYIARYFFLLNCIFA